MSLVKIMMVVEMNMAGIILCLEVTMVLIMPLIVIRGKVMERVVALIIKPS